MVLVIDADYSQMDKAVETILQAFPLSFAGKKVVIKPNILGPYPEEKGITTHPSLIRALVAALKKRGASCLVGDNPGASGYAANERCAGISGILNAADGCFINFAKETVQVETKSRWVKKLAVSKARPRRRYRHQSPQIQDPFADPDHRRGQEHVRDPGGSGKGASASLRSPA